MEEVVKCCEESATVFFARDEMGRNKLHMEIRSCVVEYSLNVQTGRYLWSGQGLPEPGACSMGQAFWAFIRGWVERIYETVCASYPWAAFQVKVGETVESAIKYPIGMPIQAPIGDYVKTEVCLDTLLFLALAVLAVSLLFMGNYYFVIFGLLLVVPIILTIIVARLKGALTIYSLLNG